MTSTSMNQNASSSLQTGFAQDVRYEKLLNQLVKRVRSSLKLQTILDITVQEVRTVLDADRTVIYRFARGWSGEVVSESLSSRSTSVLGINGTDNCFPGQYAEQYRNGRIRTVNDVQNSGLNTCHVEFLNSLQIRANAVVPIYQGEELWGLLICNQEQVRHWRSEEVELLRWTAEHLSTAIQQAQLLEQVCRQAAREALLYDITQQVHATLDLQVILDTATMRLRAALEADRVVAFELVQGGGICRNESVGVGYSPMLNLVYGSDCLPEEYTTLYAQGRILTINDVEVAQITVCHRQMLEQVQTRACLIVPVVKGGRLWGLLAVHQCNGPRCWQEEEILLVRTIGAQVATAIEHSELLAQAQQKARLVEENMLLEEARRVAEESSRLKSEFLTTVSHELRTPMNGILGTLGLLLDEDIDAEEQREMLLLCQYSSEELLRVLNDILDISKIENDHIELECEVVCLNTLLEEVIAFFTLKVKEKKLILALDAPHPCTAKADASRLRQIFINLIGNAIKFTDRGSITITATQAIGDCVRVEIQDTGIGIPLEQQSKLFEPFVQVDGSSTRRFGGTGLGLAISKKLIEQMGGTVALTSGGTGQGTTLLVQLPQMFVAS